MHPICQHIPTHLHHHIQSVVIVLTTVLTLTACSTTNHLPEGEKLYVGIGKMEQTGQPGDTPTATTAQAEVEAALSYPPNGSFLGSSSLRSPLNIGLWIYNGFERYRDKKGFGRWVFDRFGSTPVLISTVNPGTRTTIATNLMHDYGYFNGSVSSRQIPQKNPRKAKLQYTLDWGNPFFIDSLAYLKFPHDVDTLIQRHLPQSLVRRGDQFNVVTLDEERTRISDLLRNNGYYYFSPSHLTYRADTLKHPGHVNLQLLTTKNLPQQAKRRYHIGHTSLYLLDQQRGRHIDSLKMRSTTIYYTGKKPGIRPGVIFKRLFFKQGDLYSADRQALSQQLLARLGTFQYTQFQYTPADTTATCDTLDVRINAVFDKPYDAELEFNLTNKSNRQMGPGAIFTLNRKNFLRTGATLSWQVKGSYEWQTHSTTEGNKSIMNSFDFGTSVALENPRIVLPWKNNMLKRARYPQSTQTKLNADLLNRAEYFQMLSFGGSLTYQFSTNRLVRHTLTPFSLTYNTLLHTSARYDSIIATNRNLALSMADKFIPAISYTFTYDNSPHKRRHKLWWETTVKSSGNITSLLYAACGKSLTETDKTLFGTPYAQFLKLTSELRTLLKIRDKHHVALRLMGGIIHSYGNQETTPYTEQFYVGGANSIRAFTVRSIGPGRYHPKADERYGYLDETGDVKLEFNAEYRFDIVAGLKGAIFLDAGNVWELRHNPTMPGSQLTLSNFAESVATGTGAGLRYDLDFLVLRLDLGVALHMPYDTGKSGYYNVPKFSDGLGLHFAIGYPF